VSDLPRQFGKYSLLKMLAKGGMGEIYLARSLGLSQFEKYYAIKKLLKKFTHDKDVGARFIDEAKLGARLQHPNIVQVFDLGVVDEELFMACEFVDGFDLRRVLRFCHEKRKRIPLDTALFMVREILSGLAYAHRQVDAEGRSIDLIHRDISPQNVLVSFEGEVKIIDFGLAKSTQRSQETQANVLLGNFGYMSPEQARGHKLDVRTDVYSAGIVLFELVTGTKRFVDDNPLRLLEMVARPTPIMPSDRSADIPKAIDRIYAQATAPQKEDRYPSAEQFRDAVTEALNRVNPKAGRESLAQFLNHLFLGGAAPPPVDNDLLDKSVMVQVQDLVMGTDAFQTSKEEDVQNRNLTAFGEDAPQTGSHELMRTARVGDNLSHDELTGESGGAAEAPPPPPTTAPVASAAPAPELSTEEHAVTDLSQQPTSVYEAPAWSGAPSVPAGQPVVDEPRVDPASQPPVAATDTISEELELIDAVPLEPVQLEPVPLEPVPLEPASMTPLADNAPMTPGSLPPSAPTHTQFPAVNPAPTPAATSAPGSTPPTAAPDPQVPIQNLPPNAATQHEMPAVTAAMLEASQTQQTPLQDPLAPDPTAEGALDVDVSLDPSDLEPIELDVQAIAAPPAAPAAPPSMPSPSGARTSAVVSSVVASEPTPRPEPENEPTMVVNMGDSGEPPLTSETASTGGFGEGGAMESLIIDFDSSEGPMGGTTPAAPALQNAPLASSPESAEAPPAQAPSEPSGPAIRPAAQPLGRVTKGKTKPLGNRRR